jgi:hypothetical protein
VSTLPILIPIKDHMFRYLIQSVVMIKQRWKLTTVHTHGVKMATELHHPQGRTG